jgi:hypothetical protein
MAGVNVLGRVSVNSKIICKVTLSVGLFSPETLLPGVSVKEGNFIKSANEMLKSAFNAQGSRLIIVALQVGAVKIYAATTVEALKKKERPQKVRVPRPPTLEC